MHAAIERTSTSRANRRVRTWMPESALGGVYPSSGVLDFHVVPCELGAVLLRTGTVDRGEENNSTQNNTYAISYPDDNNAYVPVTVGGEVVVNF